jgi:hypothetical protein
MVYYFTLFHSLLGTGEPFPPVDEIWQSLEINTHLYSIDTITSSITISGRPRANSYMPTILDFSLLGSDSRALTKEMILLSTFPFPHWLG